MLVIDASAAFTACASPDGFRVFGREELVAPPLVLPETRSALHEAAWRGDVSRDTAHQALALLESGRIRTRTHRRLGQESWRIADALGWAKTYDAEYIALALLFECELVTLDRGLATGASRFVKLRRAADL